MDYLSQRACEILKYLLLEQKPMTIKALSENFHVSLRTIRYDLKEIEDFLKDYNLTISKKSKVGMWIEASANMVEDLRKDLEKMHCHPYLALDKENRVKKIIGLLFEESDYISYDHMADLLFVSRSTIINDMKSVEKWMQTHGIETVKRTKLGVKISCSEKQFRKALIDFINENVELEELYGLVRANTLKLANPDVRTLTQKYVATLLNDQDIALFLRFIKKIQSDLNVIFSDDSITTLMIHYGIAIKRIKAGKKIYMPRDQLSFLKALHEYDIANQNISILETGFNVKIPESEIGYIVLHLIGAKVTKEKSENELVRMYGEEIKVIDLYIEKIGEILGIYLGDDQELRKNLLLHIKPALNRIKYNMRIQNPILKSIRLHYPDIFKAAKEAADVFNSEISADMSDDEIGFIAMHIGASIERKEGKDIRYNVLVACASGIGTSKLLSSRIKSEFKNINVIDEVSIGELEEKLDDHIDLIITTAPIHSFLLKPIVKVNPFLTPKDAIRIKNALNMLNGNQVNFENDVENIMQIVKLYTKIENGEALRKHLRRYLSGENKTNYEEEQKLLTEMINEKRVATDAEIKDKESAIRFAGKLLLDDGCVEPQYIDAMLKISSELSAYIVIAPGIAMPHARPESGALKPGFSIVTLKNELKFGHPENDPVKLIFALAAIDNTSHLKALSELSIFLNEDSNVQLLRDAHSPKEIIKIIGDFEEKYLLEH